VLAVERGVWLNRIGGGQGGGGGMLVVRGTKSKNIHTLHTPTNPSIFYPLQTLNQGQENTRHIENRVFKKVHLMAYTYFPNAILFLCALLFTAVSYSLMLYGFSDYWNNSKNIKLFFYKY
jgi:hypothetical protein